MYTPKSTIIQNDRKNDPSLSPFTEKNSCAVVISASNRVYYIRSIPTIYAWIQHNFSPDSSDPTADAPSDKGSINKVIATATTISCVY